MTELYRDPNADSITAISVYLTPKTTVTGNWIEIAYGTSSGVVRVIVQHPETLGHGPQLFQVRHHSSTFLNNLLVLLSRKTFSLLIITLLGVQSWVRFCQQEFGEFPRPAWAVGSYSSPPAGGTPQILVDKPSPMTGRLRVYSNCDEILVITRFEPNHCLNG